MSRLWARLCGGSADPGGAFDAERRAGLIARRLDKLSCWGCGLIRHRQPPTPAEISAIYSGAYGLPALTGTDEQFGAGRCAG
jgi:hypothetical protein